jgi:hypothetical protein
LILSSVNLQSNESKDAYSSCVKNKTSLERCMTGQLTLSVIT